MLRNVYVRWRAFTILSKYPRASWPEMHVKITAMEMLGGKRAQWGIQRSWRGDYLNDTSENFLYEAYRNALRGEGVSQTSVLFSASTRKFNRHAKVNVSVLPTRLS